MRSGITPLCASILRTAQARALKCRDAAENQRRLNSPHPDAGNKASVLEEIRTAEETD